MKHSFATPVGTIVVVVHEASRIVSISRVDAQGRTLGSTMCDWDTTNLRDVLVSSMAVPAAEASDIAWEVKAGHPSLAFVPPSPPPPAPAPSRAAKTVEAAGIGRRFLAVLLDSVLVFFPIGFLMGFFSQGGSVEPGDSYASGASPGVDVRIVFLVLGLGYYILAESLTGTTVGKHIAGIRVVDEEGDHIGFGAAVIRNLLRLVDGLFFYLVGVIFASSSPRGQRLGDRAAHTVVVRRS